MLERLRVFLASLRPEPGVRPEDEGDAPAEVGLEPDEDEPGGS